jgi:hypothetical protein
MPIKALGEIVCVALLTAYAQVSRLSTYPYSFQQ